MSNNERLERMAAEKAAAAREKQERAEQRKKEVAARPRRSRTPGAAQAAGRVRVVWAVCNHLGDQVKTFPYPEKQQAEAEVERLSGEKGKPHYLEPRKVSMD
jgi:hypothetical protein